MSFWLAGVATLASPVPVGLICPSLSRCWTAEKILYFQKTIITTATCLFFFWYQYGMICLHLSTLNLGAVSTTHIDYASGLTRLEIYLHICKTARLGKPVPSQQWVKSSPCISGSPQAFFLRLQCSYSKWECSGRGGDLQIPPPCFSHIFVRDDELGQVQAPPSPLPFHWQTHTCIRTDGGQGERWSEM